MAGKLSLFFSIILSSNLSAFELPRMDAAGVAGSAAVAESRLPDIPAPLETRQSSYFAEYQVNGARIAVPHVGNGRRVIAALHWNANRETFAAKVREAFNSPSSAAPEKINPESRAEQELAALNPGYEIVSLNSFLPGGAAALFNLEYSFGGPNCFNAAFTAAGLRDHRKLRHVGNPEADQLLSMYYRKTPASSLRPGDVIVLNGGDHGVYYLGAGLIFHKKSYLKQHSYRIVPLERAYEPEPFEWKPGPFDNGSPFNSSEPIRKMEAWRPTGAQYEFGYATEEEKARAGIINFVAEQVELKAPNWRLSRELGYFTESLLEGLVSEWSAMGKSPNPVIRAYYHQLSSLRDQANQSIESELLSSPHAQSNAYQILKDNWLPRNDYSRALVGSLLRLYGRDSSETEAVLDAIGNSFERNPLNQVKR
ncbi:MAG TPA: hypothetical protein DDW67_09930 [Elusimicrobia bacterium]|nr:hypothetical protein [Elusimicrobiota bacterium]